MHRPSISSSSKVTTLVIADSTSYLYDVCCDHKGLIYFTDSKNHRIWKYDSTTRVATIFAGGVRGFEDGSNQKAKFNCPAGICLDNDGNILVTDQNNFRIRKIKQKDGSVVTIAGSEEGCVDGKELEAKFSSGISGICVDSKGTIFVSDTRNDRIRKIKDGKVSTLCGIGRGFEDGGPSVAKLDRPYGICCDKAGSLYIADFERIRKFNRSDNTLTTLVTLQSMGEVASVPVGICLDSLENLIVTTKSLSTIKLITEKGEIIDLTGVTEGNEDGNLNCAKFKDPRGVCLSNTGDIIVIDNGNSKVRCIKYDSKNPVSVSLSSPKKIALHTESSSSSLTSPTKEVYSPRKKFTSSSEKETKLIQEMKQQIETLQKEVEVLKNRVRKLEKKKTVTRSLGQRQTLSLTESINFLAALKISETGPLDEQIKRIYKKFPQLEGIYSDIGKWYEGWKFGINPDNLSEEQVKAICLYTHDLFGGERKDNFYFILNEILRSRSNEDMQMIGGYLSHFLRAISNLKDLQTTIYRGIQNNKDVEKNKIEKDYVVGRPIHWSGFSSGTENINVAKQFAREGGIIFVIKIHSGKSISNYSMLPKEDEILLHPNMKFKVIEGLKKGEDGYYYVRLEEEMIPIVY